MTSQLLKWHHCQTFWPCFVSLVKFSYWSKFCVNIIAGSRVMTIFFYKGLTRNPKIGTTHVWVLPNVWRPGRVKSTKFGRIISKRMLLNAEKYYGYRFYRFWVIKENQRGIKSPSTQISINSVMICFIVFINNIIQFIKINIFWHSCHMFVNLIFLKS